MDTPDVAEETGGLLAGFDGDGQSELRQLAAHNKHVLNATV